MTVSWVIFWNFWNVVFYWNVPLCACFQEQMVWPIPEISCVQLHGLRIAQCPLATQSSTSTKENCLPANRWFLPRLVLCVTNNRTHCLKEAHTLALLPYLSLCMLQRTPSNCHRTNRKQSKWSMWSISCSCRLNCHPWWFNIEAFAFILSAGFHLESLMSLNHSQLVKAFWSCRRSSCEALLCLKNLFRVKH